jgi:phosphoribosylanthranilate isomerase
MPEKASDVLKVAQEIKPDYIQLHSSLPLEELKKLRKSCKSGLILVIPIDPEAKDASTLVENAREVEGLADYLLLDTKGPRGGGTGVPHDWTISREIRDSVDKPVFLAGGLKPSNVLQAIRAVNPYGVDASSGVESKVGKKDMRLIAEFIQKVKGMPGNVRG